MTTVLTPTPAPLVAQTPPPPKEQSSARLMWSDTFVFARRNLEHIRQIPEKLLDVTIQPLMFTVLFAFVFGGAISVGGSYREYLIGGILVQTIVFGMMGPATSIATDLQEGVIDRFRSLPASNGSYLVGHVLAELAGMCLAITILLGTGFIVGWRAHTGVVDITVALALMVFFSMAMIWVGTWLGTIVRSPDAVMGIGFTVVFPLTFMSNAFVPIATMPSWLQVIAAWNPVSAFAAAVRTLFGNPLAPLIKHSWPLDNPVLISWIYTAVIVVIFIPLTLRSYRKRTAR